MLFNRRSMFKAGAAVTALALSTPQNHDPRRLRGRSTKTRGHQQRFPSLHAGQVRDHRHPGWHADIRRTSSDLRCRSKCRRGRILDERQLFAVGSDDRAIQPVLVNTGTELILFDTGNGPEGREFGTGHLASRITASGYTPADVTIVAISHLHADHINGLMEGDRPVFSQARYVVSQAEWDFWASTDFAGTPAAVHATAIQRSCPSGGK